MTHVFPNRKLAPLALVFLLLPGCSGTPTLGPGPRPRPPLPTPPPSPPDPAGVGARLLDLMNQQRAMRGLSPLTFDSRLGQAAQVQASDMAQHQKMTHTGSDGSTPWDRIARAGYTYSNASENVAWGQESPERAMEDWMNSPGHRANILGPYRQMGGAFATPPGGRSYWCATFASPR